MMQLMNAALLLVILITLFTTACSGADASIGQDLVSDPIAVSTPPQPDHDAAPDAADTPDQDAAPPVCETVPVSPAAFDLCGALGTQATICGVSGPLYVCNDFKGSPGMPGCVEQTPYADGVRLVMCPNGKPIVDTGEKCSDPVFTNLGIAQGHGERALDSSCKYTGSMKQIGSEVFSYVCCTP